MSRIAELYARVAVTLRIRVEARANADSYSLCKRGFNPTIQRTLTQLTQVARPELRLNISLIKLVPVQRIERYRKSLHC